MEFQPGDKFVAKHFKGHVEVVSVDEAKNLLNIKSIRSAMHYHTEEWNLGHTIVGFNRGDYKFAKNIVKSVKLHNSDCFGCKVNGTDYMLSTQTHDGDIISDVHELFFFKAQLTAISVKVLMKELKANKDLRETYVSTIQVCIADAFGNSDNEVMQKAKLAANTFIDLFCGQTF